MFARPEPIRNTKCSEPNILIAGSLPAVNLSRRAGTVPHRTS